MAFEQIGAAHVAGDGAPVLVAGHVCVIERWHTRNSQAAKRQLADEYDAAQERGEVSVKGAAWGSCSRREHESHRH